MSDSSEEKTDLPTPHRLRKAREDGDLFYSAELTNLLIAIGGFFMALFGAPAVLSGVNDIFTVAINQVPGAKDFDSAVMFSLAVFSTTSGTMLAACILLAIASKVTQSGFTFSMKPVTPDMNRANPSQGLRRVFSMRSWVSAVRMLVLTALSVGAVWVVFKMHIGDLARLSQANASSYLGVLILAGAHLLGGLFVVMAANSLIDILIQKQAYIKKLKMSKSEIKREHEQQEGKEEVKASRKQIGSDILADAGWKYLRYATHFVIRPGGVGVAVFHNESVLPRPVVLTKMNGDEAREYLSSIAPRVMIVYEDQMAQVLFTAGKPMMEIPKQIQARFLDLATSLLRESRKQSDNA
jgi:flagellar biosynthesis protein FlhB